MTTSDPARPARVELPADLTRRVLAVTSFDYCSELFWRVDDGVLSMLSSCTGLARELARAVPCTCANPCADVTSRAAPILALDTTCSCQSGVLAGDGRRRGAAPHLESRQQRRRQLGR